jgi:hypothetical protein
MTKEQAAEELAASELALATALANYTRQIILLRDLRLVERLEKRFKDRSTISKLQELLRDEP